MGGGDETTSLMKTPLIRKMLTRWLKCKPQKGQTFEQFKKNGKKKDFVQSGEECCECFSFPSAFFLRSSILWSTDAAIWLGSVSDNRWVGANKLFSRCPLSRGPPPLKREGDRPIIGFFQKKIIYIYSACLDALFFIVNFWVNPYSECRCEWNTYKTFGKNPTYYIFFDALTKKRMVI